MEHATNRHATMAMITASGVAPPPKVIPNGIENTTAAAGAMWVIDWKRTSRRPMASRARPSPGPDTTLPMLTPFGEPAVLAVARPDYAKVGHSERTVRPPAPPGLGGREFGRIRGGNERGRLDPMRPTGDLLIRRDAPSRRGEAVNKKLGMLAPMILLLALTAT